MDFLQSAALVPLLDALETVPSTNTELVRRAGMAADAGQPLPDRSVVVTTDQTAGRGRLGRVWVAPPGKTLAISVLLRPEHPLPLERLGWIPLLAGLAMARAVDRFVPGAAVKWPNDVRIRGLKVCGILSELLPGRDGVVVGAGVNLTLEAAELPTDVSTSLVLAGADPRVATPDAVLAAYLGSLTELYIDFVRQAGDAREGLRDAVLARCETIGQAVRVELPDATSFTGTATGIDGDGRLEVSRSGFHEPSTVAAGDVTHLRYE